MAGCMPSFHSKEPGRTQRAISWIPTGLYETRKKGSGDLGVNSATSQVTPDKTPPSGGVLAAPEPEVVQFPNRPILSQHPV
jgi:hypothetical protein